MNLCLSINSLSTPFILLLLIKVESSTKEHDVWLRTMDHVVYPTGTLTHPQLTPFQFTEEPVVGQVFGNGFREDYMAILKGLIKVPI